MIDTVFEQPYSPKIALHDILAADLPDLRPDTATTTATDFDFEFPTTMDWSDLIDVSTSQSPIIADSQQNNWLQSKTTEMTIGDAQASTSPADFAFEAPIDKTPYQYTNPNNSGYYSFSNGSSFSSSTSGLSSGSSFSTADALPAISRDFARPSPVDTRRPATAGGVLGGRSPAMPMYTQRKDTIEEEMFTNPFGSADGKMMHPADGVDPHHMPAHRRASDGFSMPPPPAWPQNPTMGLVPYTFSQQRMSAPRPQTSDGLPSFGGIPALPSARSVVGSVDGFTPISGLQPAAHIRSSFDDAMPFRDRGDMRGYTSQQSRADHEAYNTHNNSAPKKRPRRRYDEIERMYLCGWNGCEKSYGTLNHLNAHVAMQKHGEKRLPGEFKELRKAFRKRKREQAAAAANANASAQYAAWTRGSMSSDSDYSRRDSAYSMSGPRYSTDTSSGSMYYDSRPNTASSISSVNSQAHARFGETMPMGGPGPYSYDQSATAVYGSTPGAAACGSVSSLGMNGNGNGAGNSSNPSLMSVRRDSAPQHLPIPTQAMSFREAQDGPTPTQQNPFPGSTMVVGPPQTMGMQPRAARPVGEQGQASGGFPFQALTSPMPNTQIGGMQHDQQAQYGQFAFQR